VKVGGVIPEKLEKNVGRGGLRTEGRRGSFMALRRSVMGGRKPPKI